MVHELDTTNIIASVPIPKMTKRFEPSPDKDLSLGKEAKWEDRIKNRKKAFVVEFPKMIWGCQFMRGCDDLFTSSMDGRLLRWNCSKEGVTLKNAY